MSSILRLITYLLLINNCASHHILVSGTTQSYGLWNQLLHMSKELLSRTNQDGSPTNFITFVIDEDHDKWLNTIRDHNFNISSYQIIYSPSVLELDAVKIRDSGIIEKFKSMGKSMIENSLTSEPILTSYLSHSNHIRSSTYKQLHLAFNSNLTYKYNDVSSFQFQAVDVCLLCIGHMFANYVCKAFDIPVILRGEAVVAHMAESYKYWDTRLYFNEPFALDYYPDIINASIFKSYYQRSKNVIQQTIVKYVQKIVGRMFLKPTITTLNKKLSFLNKTLDDHLFDDGLVQALDNAVIIHSLGPPWASIIYQRPRVKSYGFLLYPTPAPLDNDMSELSQWINNNTTPIVYISMGSVHLLPENSLHYMYSNLIQHSKHYQYRVLWALRQNIYDNMTNHQLEMNHFKIQRWLPQLQVLQHPNVVVFVSHGGGNGVVEGFYSKTPMILYPRVGDQYFNAKRTQELQCGLMITDRDKLSDLTAHIETLLIDEISALEYKQNIEMVHQMLLQNGGIKEAADFVESTAQYGVDYLVCTLGHLYPCNERKHAWYQQTMVDGYFVMVLFTMLVIICVRRCLKSVGNVESIKYKKQ